MDSLVVDSLGSRLRLERERLQMSQEQFAEVGGVRKLTQIQYEKDATSPTAKYLMAVAAIGVDVVEVLGLSADAAREGLSKRQQALLHHHAQATKAGQQAIERIAMLEAQQAAGVAKATAAKSEKPAKKARSAG